MQNFQYPLRAYRVWNTLALSCALLCVLFQYPLRAYRVWNSDRVFSAWIAVLSFSTLCGPIGCGTSQEHHQAHPYAQLSVPSAGL